MMRVRWLAYAVVTLSAVPAFASPLDLTVGESAPLFTLKVVNSDGVGASLISLDTYFGPQAKSPKKAVLLAFFATYCEPCKQELPYLAALHTAYANDGFQVLLVSTDKQAEQIEEARKLVVQANATFPLLSDRYTIVARRYQVSKLPSLYLINGEGKVTMVHVGYRDDITRSVHDEITQALGLASSATAPDALQKFLGGTATSTSPTLAPKR